MRVLMAAAELAPLARAGGLADNVAGLAAALAAAGHDVRCALPRYGGIEARFPEGATETPVGETGLFAAGRWTRVRLTHLHGPSLGFTIVLVGHEVFEPHGIYVDEATGEPFANDALRWKVFCRALHETLGRDGWIPEIVHGHDHQTGLLMGLLRWRSSAHRPARVFTVHQLEYQGIAARPWIADSGLPNDLYYPMGPLEFHGQVNPTKLGIESANRVTTVSPSFAREVRESEEAGEGLQGVFARRAPELDGILNGIDPTIWDPAGDRHLAHRYTAGKPAARGKNRAALRAAVGLPAPRPDLPIAGVLGRVSPEKGFDLLIAAVAAILDAGAQLVVHGAGDPDLEDALRDAAGFHAGRLAVRIGWDEPLAHRIAAGSDLLLVPSRHEPSGFHQMVALRYGAVPVVRAVGGHADTVTDADADPKQGTGFTYREQDVESFVAAVRRGIRAFGDRKRWGAIVRRGMETDLSWARAAAAYGEVYRKAAEGAR